MELKNCPHCRVRVVPSSDGTCPSCRRSFHEVASPGQFAAGPSNRYQAPATSGPPVPGRIRSMLARRAAIVLVLAVMHFIATAWCWPVILPWRPSNWTPFRPSASDAFNVWLLSLPVGFVAEPWVPGQAWLAVPNSLIVATFVYAIVWHFPLMLRIATHGLIELMANRTRKQTQSPENRH